MFGDNQLCRHQVGGGGGKTGTHYRKLIFFNAQRCVDEFRSRDHGCHAVAHGILMMTHSEIHLAYTQLFARIS